MIRGLLLIFGTLTAVARGWDPAGHMLIGQIAWEQTRPEARARVNDAAKRLESTYNAGRPYHFVTAGCWMDDLRSKKGYPWAAWHYVTIAWSADGSGFALPPAPHVVWAIEDNLRTLRETDTSSKDAALAIAMLIHFVGDVHQPLHATDRGDRGGNGVLITGVPFTDLWPGTVANLHASWDKAFRFDRADSKVVELWIAPDVAGRPSAPAEGVIAAEAGKICGEFPRTKFKAALARSEPAEWARESHLVGCTAGYPAGATASDHEVVAITPEFAAKARAIAAERVALAGYRLADLLNRLFAK